MKKSFLTHIIFLLACTSLGGRNYSSGAVAASQADALEILWSHSIGCEDRGGPAIAPDGTIYAYADFKYHAIKGSSPLGGSSWLTMGGNNYGSGRISGN